jgi:hypothetical protein
MVAVRNTITATTMKDPTIGAAIKDSSFDSSHQGELKLTPCRRLCDLMSLTRLAYLFLGIETVESFNALL